MKTKKVSHIKFKSVITKVVEIDKRFKDNLDIKATYRGYNCYLSDDKQSGYAIHKKTCELVNVFSIAKGMGKILIKDACDRNDELHLDCFEGYLSELYQSCGFTIDRAEANWNKGEPDVLYMCKHKTRKVK